VVRDLEVILAERAALALQHKGDSLVWKYKASRAELLVEPLGKAQQHLVNLIDAHAALCKEARVRFAVHDEVGEAL